MAAPTLPGVPAEKIGPFQFMILVLSLVVIAGLMAETFLHLPGQVAKILRLADTVICGFFLVDFGLRFHRAPSKLRFMRWGWIDLVASIPAFDLARWGRFASVFRIIRLLRGVRSVQRLFALLYTNRGRGGVASVVMVTFLFVTFSSVGILLFERSPGGNIHTAEDALWWSVTTITTVGYGDKYPVTTEGRVLAMALMFSGVGLFGTFSGIIASLFLGKVEAEEDEILAEVRALRAEIAQHRASSHLSPPP